MKLVGLLHSTRLVIEPVHRVMAGQCPGTEFVHVLDEGILRRLAALGQITPEIVDWLAGMARSAERAGAEIAVLSCSSLSPCVREMQRQVGIPVVRIDEPMMAYALDHANRIGLVMTNPTTEGPSKRLFDEVSARKNRRAELVPRLCRDAFARLNGGDVEGHDRAVADTVEALLPEVDLVLLAQISIARVKDGLPATIRERVFSSLDFIAPEVNRRLAAGPQREREP